ncbi:MAG TPA: periplasmic heavy metal sensor [Nitrospirota bacterium]
MNSKGLLKFALAASLALNIAVLGTVGFFLYQRSGNWVSPFGTTMKKGRFVFEELSLRPEQMKAMKERAILFRAEIDRKRQEIAEKRKTLIALLRADEPDRKAIDAAIAEISTMQEEMQRTITSHMLEQKARLDKDQQKKFLDLVEQHMTGAVQTDFPPMGVR